MKKILMLMLLVVMAFTTTQTFAQTKKDGTKDMRYKANKQPLKKDGTPDKRFKSTKKVTKTDKKTVVTKPVKK